MKQYYKEINGEKEFLGKVLIYNGLQIFNPTEELILEAGYQEYIPEEETIEEPLFTLEDAIRDKINLILDYDSSPNVNILTVNGIDLWIPADKRAALKISVDAYNALGIDIVTKVWEGVEYTATCDQWLYMINSVEVYASECFNTTQRHINAVKLLTTIQEVENYDNTTGYPEKLNFEI